MSHETTDQDEASQPRTGAEDIMPTVAILGCVHGKLDAMYQAVAETETYVIFNPLCILSSASHRPSRALGKRIDLVLCCGDFQAVRTQEDLDCLACPPKYRAMCDFHKYYSGQVSAPKPTIFIGGNHEASNYLQRHPLGAYLAPNIFYLGYANVIHCLGLRIAGLSGIYNARHYHQDHWEHPPYTPDSLRSVYHTRKMDVDRLQSLSGEIDIFMSHDWPEGVTKYGNEADLLRRKPFFRQDVESGRLGSPALTELMETLRPTYWVSAHMHYKFVGLRRFQDGRETRFVALDKVIAGREFLQILEFPDRETMADTIEMTMDLEWFRILRKSLGREDQEGKEENVPFRFPQFGESRFDVVPESLGLDVHALFQVAKEKKRGRDDEDAQSEAFLEKHPDEIEVDLDGSE